MKLSGRGGDLSLAPLAEAVLASLVLRSRRAVLAALGGRCATTHSCFAVAATAATTAAAATPAASTPAGALRAIGVLGTRFVARGRRHLRSPLGGRCLLTSGARGLLLHAVLGARCTVALTLAVSVALGAALMPATAITIAITIAIAIAIAAGISIAIAVAIAVAISVAVIAASIPVAPVSAAAVTSLAPGTVGVA